MSLSFDCRQAYVVQAVDSRGAVLHTTYVNARLGVDITRSPRVREWLRLFVDRDHFHIRARVADPVRDLGCTPTSGDSL